MLPIKLQIGPEPDNDLDGHERTQYMLAELEHTREQLGIFAQRFENLITLYMAGLAALLSAIVILLTSAPPPLIQRASLALVGIGAWGFSVVIFARLCITRSLMVNGIAIERRNKQYFLDRYSGLQRYSTYLLPTTGNSDIPSRWQKQVFTSQTIKFFYALATFVSFLAALTSAMILATAFELLGLPVWLYSGFHLGWYSVGALGAFALTLLSLQLILRAQRSKAEGWARREFGALHQVEK